MLKLASLATTLLVLLGTLPSQSEGGIFPGRTHGEVWFLVFNYRNSQANCYGEKFDRNSELFHRQLFKKCGYKGTNVRHTRSIMDYMIRMRPQISFQNNSLDATDEYPTQFYDAETVRSLKDILVENVKFLECVFDGMDLKVLPSGQVDASTLKNKYQSNTDIPSDIKGILIDSVTTCEKQSINEDSMMWGKAFSHFFKRYHFFFCSEANKSYACMKASLRRSADDFDLSGLDGVFSDISDDAKRYIIASTYPNVEKTGLFDF